MTEQVLHLSADHAARFLGAAQACFPNECCGLLEGRRAEDGWHVAEVHEMPNVADEPAREFLVDPQSQIALLRRLRETARSVIGCFHSHPGGRAEPSAEDLARALADDSVWLIAAGGPDDFSFSAYLFSSGAFTHLRIEISA